METLGLSALLRNPSAKAVGSWRLRLAGATDCGAAPAAAGSARSRSSTTPRGDRKPHEALHTRKAPYPAAGRPRSWWLAVRVTGAKRIPRHERMRSPGGSMGMLGLIVWMAHPAPSLIARERADHYLGFSHAYLQLGRLVRCLWGVGSTPPAPLLIKEQAEYSAHWVSMQGMVARRWGRVLPHSSNPAVPGFFCCYLENRRATAKLWSSLSARRLRAV